MKKVWRDYACCLFVTNLYYRKQLLFRKTGICVAISLAYVFLVASLLIAFFLPIGPARRIMKLISNYWLGILLYLILAVLMADAICFLLFLITKRRLKCRTAAAGGICAMVVLVLSAWGAYNARIIQVKDTEKLLLF